MVLKTLSLSRIKRGQRIFVRIDANIPLVKGRIAKGGTWRLEKTLLYLRALSERGAVVILCSHLGRPEGKVVKDLRLTPVQRWFKRVGKLKISMASDVTGEKVETLIKKAKPGEVVLLENVRFDEREREDSRAFAKELANLAEVYVNNAFGTCHRKHASVHAIAKILPSYAGPLLVEEVKALSSKRRKRFVLVMGGLKLKTKMPVIEQLAPEADIVLVGGGLALTLLAVRDRRSLLLHGEKMKPTELKLARRVMKQFADKIVLPVDLTIRDGKKVKYLWSDEVGSQDAMIDTGPRTREQFAQHLEGAKTIIWNGTMGIIEERVAQAGTIALTKSILKQKQAKTILGGGDTISFLRKKHLATGFTHLSTGGGAMLVFLGGGSMPGLDVLKK